MDSFSIVFIKLSDYCRKL